MSVPRGSPDAGTRVASVKELNLISIIWICVIGLVAGIVARMLSPAPDRPSDFVLTTVLGVGGALVSTLIGQATGWYQLNQGVGLLGAIAGSLILLLIWHLLASRSGDPDPGKPGDPGTTSNR
jgi:uncharacterized membrane protein YeaQ/YmgE (transglycosylase-associated protein family)